MIVVNMIKKMFSFNYTKLEIIVSDYETKYYKKPYIFVNEETLKELAKKNIDSPISINFDRSNVIVRYHGCAIYLNNELEFGEVEIR